MRRRLLFLVSMAVLAASVAVPSFAARAYAMKLGSTFTITGRTGSETGKQTRATGKVVLSGRWGIGRWRVIETTSTDHAGNYRFTFKPHRRGELTLRIAPPDHHPRRYLLHVS